MVIGSRDTELLRRFEPVLAFADKERFHPLAIEAYLACCDLFERVRGWRRWFGRSRKVTAVWDERADSVVAVGTGGRGARRAAVLSSFDACHFLRFLDPEARRAQKVGREGETARPPWFGFLTMAALLGLGCWLAYRNAWIWPGRLLLAFLALVLVAMLYGWLELRFDSDRAKAVFMALLAATVLLVVARSWSEQAWWRWWATLVGGALVAGGIQIWGRISLSARAAVGLNRLSAAPVVLSVIWLLLSIWLGVLPVALLCGSFAVVLLLVLSDDLAAAYMAVFSPLRREASAQAVVSERRLREAGEKQVFPYYGRVWRDPDGRRVALQYFYFYAFNDWRGQGGLNFHEADWEWATLFLRRQDDEYVPQEVALSQHHSVGRRSWDEVERTGPGGEHPVIYVAVGSHANYFEPGKVALADLVRETWLRRVLKFVFESRRRSRQAADEGVAMSQSWMGRKAPQQSVDLTTADDPDGKGLVVGPAMPVAGPPDRQTAEWTPVVLDGHQPWIDYQGLWGLRSLLRNESGPPGPQWEREENLSRSEREGGRRRLAWENPVAPQ